MFLIAFVVLDFYVKSKKKKCQNYITGLSVSSMSFMASGLNIQVFNPFWVSFCIWYKIVVQFPPSHWLRVCPFLWYILSCLVINYWLDKHGLISILCSIPLIPCHFDYYSFVIHSWPLNNTGMRSTQPPQSKIQINFRFLKILIINSLLFTSSITIRVDWHILFILYIVYILWMVTCTTLSFS